jgi:hypothetical protein
MPGVADFYRDTIKLWQVYVYRGVDSAGGPVPFTSTSSCTVQPRETREGWPLLTVETEVNGTQRVQMKVVILLPVIWACHAGTRDFCPALATLVSQLFQFLCPHRPASWAVGRPGSPVSLHVSMV